MFPIYSVAPKTVVDFLTPFVDGPYSVTGWSADVRGGRIFVNCAYDGITLTSLHLGTGMVTAYERHECKRRAQSPPPAPPCPTCGGTVLRGGDVFIGTNEQRIKHAVECCQRACEVVDDDGNATVCDAWADCGGDSC